MTNEYTYGDYYNYVSFENGLLSCSTYSYEIDSAGELELNRKETFKLYEAMKQYYENEEG